MVYREPIDGYSISYSSNTNYEAKIYCYKDNQTVGYIHFLKDGDTIPENSVVGAYMHIYYSISRFNDIANILRYEKPLKIAVNTSTKYGSIYTGSIEEVGEEES